MSSATKKLMVDLHADDVEPSLPRKEKIEAMGNAAIKAVSDFRIKMQDFFDANKQVSLSGLTEGSIFPVLFIECPETEVDAVVASMQQRCEGLIAKIHTKQVLVVPGS